MPRGGGFRGGGFRGGGFRGGGFRGGGFRGGGFRGGGFRGGGFRPSGRPFGRTGATRIVSRSPRGPYSHSMYRPRRYYYRPWWWYHRPWYYRWWYSPWWAGHYYRPWYYSPMYIGGGISFLILMALILLPAFGVAFLYPFSDADINGYVNYSASEDLLPNQFWWESENIEAGNDITYDIDSSIANINFGISDHSFGSLPFISLNHTEIGSVTLIYNQYEYAWMFLRPGSIINFDFNASDQIDFFIADLDNLDEWDRYQSPTFEYSINDITEDSGMLIINRAHYYYVVWYNDELSPVDVDFTVNFTMTDVVDFTDADFYIIDTNSVIGTYNVLNSGNWYFFIYFEPMNFDPWFFGTTITRIDFDVSYDTGITSVDRWLEVSPILIIVVVVVVILIIAAVIARKGQKKLKSKAPPKPVAPTEPAAPTEPTKPMTPTIPIKEAPPSTHKCIRCGATHSPDAQFCPNCGGKIQGRQLGTPSVTTPAMSKTCSYCGSKLMEKDKFCKWCGTKIEQ
ncbi:MAG: zinc ribbon domain-containing protein [Candidatus Hodarchaeota archaeon]